jgi:hypothetical protein
VFKIILRTHQIPKNIFPEKCILQKIFFRKMFSAVNIFLRQGTDRNPPDFLYMPNTKKYFPMSPGRVFGESWSNPSEVPSGSQSSLGSIMGRSRQGPGQVLIKSQAGPGRISGKSQVNPRQVQASPIQVSSGFWASLGQVLKGS